MIDPAKFQEETNRFIDIWQTANNLRLQMMAYNGVISGVDCIVIGVVQDPSDPTKEVIPLAIVITPEVFDMLGVQGTIRGDRDRAPDLTKHRGLCWQLKGLPSAE